MAFVGVCQTWPPDALLHLEVKVARQYCFIAHTFIFFIKNLLSFCDIQGGVALGRIVIEVIFRSVVQPSHTLAGSWMFLRHYSLFSSASALRTRRRRCHEWTAAWPASERGELSISCSSLSVRERERENLAVSLSLSLCLFSSPL